MRKADDRIQTGQPRTAILEDTFLPLMMLRVDIGTFVHHSSSTATLREHTVARLEIWYDTEMNPGVSWTSYSITINEAAGWKLNQTNQYATEADIRTALSFVDGISIRGEYRGGSDIGGLDNVVLETEC
jgi:hypothetical protein